MMILKKKEIIAASLVVLIGLAGYLNWSYQDTVRIRDNESYVETGKMLGEAEMVSANNETEEKEGDKNSEDEAENTEAKETDVPSMETTAYFDDAKMNRETARAAAMESLKEVSEDNSADEQTRKLAGEKLVTCAKNIELESSIENIAAAKGFSDICVYINENSATVTVKRDGLTDDDAAKLTDIITGTAKIPASSIKIIAVKGNND